MKRQEKESRFNLWVTAAVRQLAARLTKAAAKKATFSSIETCPSFTGYGKEEEVMGKKLSMRIRTEKTVPVVPNIVDQEAIANSLEIEELARLAAQDNEPPTNATSPDANEVKIEPESTGNSGGRNSSNIEKCLLSWQKRG